MDGGVEISEQILRIPEIPASATLRGDVPQLPNQPEIGARKLASRKKSSQRRREGRGSAEDSPLPLLPYL